MAYGTEVTSAATNFEKTTSWLHYMDELCTMAQFITGCFVSAKRTSCCLYLIIHTFDIWE